MRHSFYFLMTLLWLPFVCMGQKLLLPNGDFEKALRGWERPKNDNGMSQLAPEAAYAGAYGLRVAATGAAGSSAYSPRVRAVSGMVYRANFFARALQGQGIGVYLVFYDQQGKQIALDKNENPLAVSVVRGSAWQSYFAQAQAPKNAHEVGLWIHSFNNATVTADFDDFSLERISVEQAKRIPVSPTSSGQVELPVWPKQNPVGFLSSLKVLQAQGQALRTAQENWADARLRVKQDPKWQTWADSRIKEVDTWMSTHTDRTDWKSGWWHDFVSDKDGSFLVWEAVVPGENGAQLRDRKGHVVAFTPKLMDAWVFRFRMRHAAYIREAAQLWRLTGDTRYRDWAASQLDFYADNYEKWPLHSNKGGPARLHLQPLDEAVMLTELIDAARLLDGPNGVRPSREKQWADKLFKPIAQTLTQSRQIIHNIALWQRAAQAQAGLFCGDDLIFREALDGAFGVRAQVEKGVTDEYFWHEQSLGYNQYVVKALGRLLTLSGLLGEADLLQREGAIAQNLLLSPALLRFPDGTLPTPADSTGRQKAGFSAAADYYRILPTFGGLNRAKKIRSWDTLLDPPEAILAAAQANGQTALSQLPAVVSADLTTTRFAVLKQGPWQVFFHYGQWVPSHAQQEALSWEAYYKDAPVSLDAGTVGYGSPMHHAYYKKGPAHNVPLVNGTWPQAYHVGQVDHFSADQVVAQQWISALQTRAVRGLAIAGESLVETTGLQYEGPLQSGVNMGVLWQFEGKVRFPEGEAVADVAAWLEAILEPVSAQLSGKTSAADLKTALAPFSYWKNVHIATFTDTATVHIALANGSILACTVNAPGKFVLCVADVPGMPPARRTAVFVQMLAPTKTADFTMTLAPILGP